MRLVNGALFILVFGGEERGQIFQISPRTRRRSTIQGRSLMKWKSLYSSLRYRGAVECFDTLLHTEPLSGRLGSAKLAWTRQVYACVHRQSLHWLEARIQVPDRYSIFLGISRAINGSSFAGTRVEEGRSQQILLIAGDVTIKTSRTEGGGS